MEPGRGPDSADSEDRAGGFPAADAIDGSTSTRWSAGDEHPGRWLTVDLGSTTSVTVTGVRIVCECYATNYRYLVDGSTDNDTWTTLLDRRATTGTNQVQAARVRRDDSVHPDHRDRFARRARAAIRNLQVYDRPFTANLGTFKLVNRSSGKVLDISGASTADGATVIRWVATGGANQDWQLVAV